MATKINRRCDYTIIECNKYDPDEDITIPLIFGAITIPIWILICIFVLR